MKNITYKKILILPIITMLFFSMKTFGQDSVNEKPFYYKNKNLLISRSCQKSNCEALQVIKNISKNTVNLRQFELGINPDSVLCHYKENSKIITINNISFCQYSDNSFISIKSLNYYYNKNSKN